MDHDFTALVVVTLIFGGPVAAWIISRVLAHQERVEMIRRGFVPPPDPAAVRRAARMGWQQPPPPGAPYPPPGMPGVTMPPPGVYGEDVYARAQLRKGITVTMIGLAITIGLGTIEHGYPGPWLLGGLVPMFVGIAQVINAVINGARLPGFSGTYGGPQAVNFGPPPHDQAPYTPGPPPGPPGAPRPPTPPGPYAWRPGPTTPIESEKNNNAGS
jgi:hypothetical protein